MGLGVHLGSLKRLKLTNVDPGSPHFAAASPVNKYETCHRNINMLNGPSRTPC